MPRAGDGPSEDAAADRVDEVSAPSDAFQALGNEVRTGILETMVEYERDRPAAEDATPVSFSDLFDASDVETSAGFAYHLDQLVGPYLRKSGSEREGKDGGENAGDGTDTDTVTGYELTYAGRRVARDIATGSYTTSVDHPPVALDDACPFCEREALEARSADNVVTVACAGCDRTVLDLGFPPSGIEAHGEDFPDALDRYHRHRLGRMRDGICPDCGGEVVGTLVTPSANVAAELPSDHADHVQADLSCDSCGARTRCPVSLTLLGHAAVVSFYREHDRDVAGRPIWNVGSEWGERVLAVETEEDADANENETGTPLAVRVVVELDGDVLALYVDESLSVIAQRDEDVDADASTSSRPEPAGPEPGRQDASSDSDASSSSSVS